MATVRPLRAAAPVRATAPPAPSPPDRRGGEATLVDPTADPDRTAFARAVDFPQRVRTPAAARAVRAPTAAQPTEPSKNTLDGSWDKRLGRGLVSPDSSIDLHGHTLASAHALLDQGLDRALRRGDRLLLLVTGKPPRPDSERPHARGAIRAAVADWLAASRFSDRIAAVRGAHPRHGGAGALYIVLRRPRGG